MTLEGMLQALRAFVCEIRGTPAAGAGPLAAEAERLQSGLRRNYALLMEQRRDIERLARRVGRTEKCVADLTCRVATLVQVGDRPEAYRAALELDRLRQTAAEERARLGSRQQEHQEQVAALQRLQQHRERVESRLQELQLHTRPPKPTDGYRWA
jgi:hypothetical protein